jgi:hypothetical protein
MVKHVYIFEEIRDMPRPEDADAPPPHWRIYNAARPLPGSIEWTGEFLHGVFYAAIDPDDDRADWMEERCLSLDGHLVTFVPKDEVVQWVHAYYAKEYPRTKIDWDNVDYKDMVMSWLNYHRRMEEEGRDADDPSPTPE